MSPIQVFAFVVLCGVASAGSVTDANNYIDYVLYTPFRQELPYSYLEPYPLPNVTYEFAKGGKANFYNCKLHGMGDVRRQGNCEGTKRIAGVVSLNCTLAFERVSVECKGVLKQGILSASINAKGNFSKALGKVQVVQRIPVYSYRPEVFALNVVMGPTLKFKVTGLGPFNSYLKKVQDTTATVIAPQFYTVFNGRFREVLSNSVPKANFPSL